MHFKLTVYAVAAAIFFGNVGAHAQEYTVTDLNASGGPVVPLNGLGINASGQVTGVGNSGGVQVAYLYSGGTVTNLDFIPGGTSSYAHAINNKGQVTGEGSYTSANNNGHAFLYSSGQMTDLGALVNGSGTSVGYGINDLGQVVGQSGNAFIYSNGQMLDLNSLAHSSPSNFTLVSGQSINNSGQVTGQAILTLPSNVNVVRAFLYSNGTVTNLGALGTVNSDGYVNSQGNAINASGQVTGYSGTASSSGHAFLYSNGTMTDLGTLGGTISYGEAINASSQVVGQAYLSGNAAAHAFLYSNGTMSDLNAMIGPAASLYTLVIALGINDSGQIVANGYINSTEQGVVLLLTPTNSWGNSTDGPIPLWALGALSAGLVGIASRRLQKSA